MKTSWQEDYKADQFVPVYFLPCNNFHVCLPVCSVRTWDMPLKTVGLLSLHSSYITKLLHQTTKGASQKNNSPTLQNKNRGHFSHKNETNKTVHLITTDHHHTLHTPNLSLTWSACPKWLTSLCQALHGSLSCSL